MAIVASGAVAIKDDTLQAGSTSIALEVDGNTTGDKHLATLGSSAGLATGGTSMTEFYSYSSATPPSAPTSHSIFEDGLGNVSGSFTDESSDEDGFRIEVEVNGLGYTFWGNNVPNDETYTAPGGTLDAVNNDEVQFRVRAYNTGGDSSWAYSNLIILEQQV